MSLLRRFFPRQSPVPISEKLWAGASAFLAITLIWLSKERYPLHFNDTLLASMGATAVLLYATPHSTLVQPYSIVGGHLVSALIGVLAQQWVPVPFAAGAAVGGAIIAMHLLGCLHPPGGATALYAVSGGSTVWVLEFDYVLRPVSISAGLMLVIGLLINNLRINRQRYPAPLPAPPASAMTWVSGPRATPDDVRSGLVEAGTYLDVDEDDLWALYQKADLLAHRRFLSMHRVSDLLLDPADTIAPNAPLEEVWQKLLSSQKDCLIVVDEVLGVLGIITATDAIKRLSIHESPNPVLSKGEGTAIIVMSQPVQTVDQSAALSDAAALLAEGVIHHVPVVDSKGELTGVITHTDLWSLVRTN